MAMSDSGIPNMDLIIYSFLKITSQTSPAVVGLTLNQVKQFKMNFQTILLFKNENLAKSLSRKLLYEGIFQNLQIFFDINHYKQLSNEGPSIAE